MKRSTMGSRCWGWAVVVGLAFLVAAPAVAQLESPANAFPTASEKDGKFLALAGTEFATLTQGRLSFSLQVPATTPDSNHDCLSPSLSGKCVFLGIFDGDTDGHSFQTGVCSGTGGGCSTAADCPVGQTCDAAMTADQRARASLGQPNSTAPLQHWDNLAVSNVAGAAGTELGIALFSDPNQVASTAAADFIGYWRGNSTANMMSFPAGDPDWVAFGGGNFQGLFPTPEDPPVGPLPGSLARFPDNGWWNLELEVNPCTPGDPGCAQAATGVQSYHLCLFYNPVTPVDSLADADVRTCSGANNKACSSDADCGPSGGVCQGYQIGRAHV